MTLEGQDGSGFIRVARREDLQRGGMKEVVAAGREVLLCDVGGEVFAVQDECTHESFPLSHGTLQGETLICRLHGARFDVRTGEVLALPACRRLRTYPVRIDGGDVWVAIPGNGSPEQDRG